MASAVKAACGSISDAVVSFESYLFLAEGKYTNTADYVGYSRTISENMAQVGRVCGEINSVESPQTITHLSTMMESMGSLFDSISEYETDIVQRDVDNGVLNAFSDFCGDAWSMIVSVSSSVTDCSFLASQQSPARFLQSGFFSIGQINPHYQTFYQTIDLACGSRSSAGPGASASLNMVPATSFFEEPTASPQSSQLLASSSTNSSNLELGAPGTSSSGSSDSTLVQSSSSLEGETTVVVSIATFGPTSTSTTNGAGLLGASALSAFLFFLI